MLLVRFVTEKQMCSHVTNVFCAPNSPTLGLCQHWVALCENALCTVCLYTTLVVPVWFIYVWVAGWMPVCVVLSGGLVPDVIIHIIYLLWLQKCWRSLYSPLFWCTLFFFSFSFSSTFSPFFSFHLPSSLSISQQDVQNHLTVGPCVWPRPLLLFCDGGCLNCQAGRRVGGLPSVSCHRTGGPLDNKGSHPSIKEGAWLCPCLHRDIHAQKIPDTLLQ